MTPLFAGKPSVVLASHLFVEQLSTDANGKPRRTLVPVKRIERGDRLIVVLRYRNAGPTPVDGVAVTNPVPSALRIDMTNPAMQVSIDHGQSWGRLDRLSVATGLGGTRRATADDVTHVRWSVPHALRPGAQGQISYRAIVR